MLTPDSGAALVDYTARGLSMRQLRVPAQVETRLLALHDRALPLAGG